MREAVILGGVRTPIGRFLGALKTLPATELGARVVGEAIRRAGLQPEDIDEVIMGNVLAAGLGQTPARQAALGAGIPPRVAALTVNKVCGSGLKAVILAAQAVRLGDQECVVAGGMESMSRAPFLINDIREGLRLGNGRVLDSMITDGLWDVYNDFHMGCTGEVVARKYSVSRQAQDEYALASHEKAVAAIDAGRFRDEILQLEIPQKKKKEPIRFETDESPRRDSSMEALSRLRPAFDKEGTVTAGNAPGVNDGAAALVVTSAEKAASLGRAPLARIRAYATTGIEPELVMMAPVAAVESVLEKTGWSRDDVDLFELNEAFSVQALAVMGELKLKPEKVNINGGAVALGHPIGASGARILVTLLHAMQQRKVGKGIAALCLGGGNAVAMAVEIG
ncbi:MAG: acetyl-CoA C-acetyltransferase [Acidobacteria bacterium]|nr:acetyl-CoA C-acetyltransferase [Acidobacteriota bacterium]